MPDPYDNNDLRATPVEEEIFWQSVIALYAHGRWRPLARELHSLSKFILDTRTPAFRSWVERQDTSIRVQISSFSTQFKHLLNSSSCTQEQFCKLVGFSDDFFLTNFLYWNTELATFLESHVIFLRNVEQSWSQDPCVASADHVDLSDDTTISLRFPR